MDNMHWPDSNKVANQYNIRDENKAVESLNKSIEADNKIYSRELFEQTMLLAKKAKAKAAFEAVREQLEEAAKLGNHAAQFALAEFLWKGEHLLYDKKISQYLAVFWYNKAAESTDDDLANEAIIGIEKAACAGLDFKFFDEPLF
jgi:TPR repeat protein